MQQRSSSRIFLQEAVVSSSDVDRHVNSLTLSIQHFVCRPRRRTFSEVPRGFGEAVVACDMPQPCTFPSLDSCRKRFLWTHKEVGLAPHPVVGLVLQVDLAPHPVVGLVLQVDLAPHPVVGLVLQVRRYGEVSSGTWLHQHVANLLALMLALVRLICLRQRQSMPVNVSKHPEPCTRLRRKLVPRSAWLELGTRPTALTSAMRNRFDRANLLSTSLQTRHPSAIMLPHPSPASRVCGLRE